MKSAIDSSGVDLSGIVKPVASVSTDHRRLLRKTPILSNNGKVYRRGFYQESLLTRGSQFSLETSCTMHIQHSSLQ